MLRYFEPTTKTPAKIAISELIQEKVGRTGVQLAHAKVAHAIKMLLESYGYRVLEATSGDEGLRLFLSNSVDAVVLDYQMPGMNGAVVATKMKRVRSNVPIMLLSSYGPLPKSKLKAVDIFLSKSASQEILLSTLQRLLNRQPKPFFSRWFNTWRSQNEGARK
jgi:CheY-like chemotaxis protein